MPETKLTSLPQSIALHLGAHKTASSHLQNVLYQNRQLLADENIRVYGPGYLRQKGRGLAEMFNLSWSSSPTPRRTPEEQLRFLAKGYRRVVFSEENFVGQLYGPDSAVPMPLYPMAADRVAELVAKWAPIKPQLFVAIRNPATFLASAYGQVLFGQNYLGPQAFRGRNDWRDIDWAEYVARLRALPGLREVYVWRQEDYAATHKLILRRLLRWKVGAKVKPVPGRIHEGLSGNAVRQTLAWAKEGQTGDLARAARAAHPISRDCPKYELFAPSVIAEAAACYDEQVARIRAMEGVHLLEPAAKSREG